MLDDFTVFVNNKYYKWYKELVESRIEKRSTNVGEHHHFIPKSIRANDDLVFLTHREHYIAHLLLTKCVQPAHRKKMLYAVTAMKIRVLKHTKFNSRLFESLKIAANKSRSASRMGHAVSEETRSKLRDANLGKKASAETRAKMSLSAPKKHSPEQIEKARKSNTGRKRSAETCQKMRDKKALLTPIWCPHCDKDINPGNYHRWHGDNCKSRVNDVA